MFRYALTIGSFSINACSTVYNSKLLYHFARDGDGLSFVVFKGRFFGIPLKMLCKNVVTNVFISAFDRVITREKKLRETSDTI